MASKRRAPVLKAKDRRSIDQRRVDRDLRIARAQSRARLAAAGRDAQPEPGA